MRTIPSGWRVRTGASVLLWRALLSLDLGAGAAQATVATAGSPTVNSPAATGSSAIGAQAPGRPDPSKSGVVPSGTPPAATPAMPVPSFLRDCKLASGSPVEMAPLPNTMRAVRDRKAIRILTIGAPSIVGDGLSPGYQQALQQTLEKTIKGLAVDVVNRGVSGELARDAAERLKVEVALVQPDLVIWQVGTSDALARVPVADFTDTLREALRWLKSRDVDVILVGAKYTKRLKKDRQYQALRSSVFKVAKQENVMRISQYRAMEALEKAESESSLPMDAYELSEDIYPCVAQYAAESVIARWFAQKKSGSPSRH